MDRTKILEALDEKFSHLGENTDMYLKGLLHAKPITYWDYIQVDTLLSLQKTRTPFKDEYIFVVYHQVTELVLNMMIHEIKQLSSEPFNEDIWLDKFTRLNRYTEMLITSFDVMKYGMSYEDYNTFRASLAPASGFQSVSFRLIEVYCTSLNNLLNTKGKERIGENPTIDEYFEHVYWKDAGLNRKTGKKTHTLKAFEDKYLDELKQLAKEMNGKTLEDIFEAQPNASDELKEQLRAFDFFYNVKWPITHLETAQHYLDAKGENKKATGGSEWKKYLHPRFQQRKFFPKLWNEEEIKRWGETL